MSDKDLDRAIESLRTPVEVGPLWRERLLRAIDSEPTPRVLRVAGGDAEIVSDIALRRWSVRPVPAIAAAILLVAMGAAAGVLFERTSVHAPSTASAGSAASTNRSAADQRLTAVRFVIVAPRAARVSLVGDFNRWNPAATPMRLSGDGQSWLIEVPLSPGRHVYAFVVDGNVIRDVAAPTSVEDDFGVPNSVILVAEGKT